MTSFWKNLKIEERQKLIQILNTMYSDTNNDDIWLVKTNALRLTEILLLKMVPTLRICHQVAKSHPEVIVGLNFSATQSENEHQSILSEQKQAAKVPLQYFMLIPPNLLQKLKIQSQHSKSWLQK